jgi:hypothetical protein
MNKYQLHEGVANRMNAALLMKQMGIAGLGPHLSTILTFL